MHSDTETTDVPLLLSSPLGSCRRDHVVAIVDGHAARAVLSRECACVSCEQTDWTASTAAATLSGILSLELQEEIKCFPFRS